VNGTPWWLKIAAKIFLSRLPVGYKFWNRLRLFRHGNMDNSWLAANKFILHLDRAYPDNRPDHFTCLELGPGDSLVTGILANALGASEVYLVDVGSYATEELSYYRSFCQELKKRDFKVPDLSGVNSFLELQKQCRIKYKVNGLDDLRRIPSNSIDLIWSHSMLEHVRKREFPALVSELRRIISDKGIVTHNADLKDHLGGALNNLRFSESIWESDFMAKSGFYTNRLQHRDILEYFINAGFEVITDEVGRWPMLPTPWVHIDKQFKAVPEEEISIRSFHITLRPSVQQTDSQ
jgi:hypothetical protein